jgi:hypothetical protein
VEKRKTISKTMATVSASSTLGFLAARAAGYFQGAYDFYIFLGLFILLLANVVYISAFDAIEDFVWSLMKRNRLRKPSVGILNVSGCPRGSTRFTPDDWLQRLQEVTNGRGFRVSLINSGQVSGKYDAIINPYGEYYPETDLAELDSLVNIKQYISQGGMFVNPGGLAFFYGYDNLRRRQATLGKELEGYLERTMNDGTRMFLPGKFWPSTYAFSLSDTPLWNFFKVQTTIGDAVTVTVFQADEDRHLCGEIYTVGGIDQVREFRAAREPLRNAKPLLRARWPTAESAMVVYPLIAIPQNRGCLVLGGMALDSGITVNGVNLDSSEKEKIIQALVNLLENQRRGNIPFDWRKC